LEEKHGITTSKDANEYIKTKEKIIKAELDIKFIKDCLNNEVLPKFSNLKIATNNRQHLKWYFRNIAI